MKKVTLLVATVLCSLGAFAQGEYPINWDKDANLTFTRSGDRQTSSVSITVDGEKQTIDVLSKSSVVYRDFSDQTFTVQPGAEIVPSMAYAGEWMHGYVYLDTNNNGAFDVNGYDDQNDELVAFSFYSPYDSSNGVNGIGESKSNNCNVNPMNAFKAPEKPGQYRMRYIIDWNCIDPAGQYGSNYSSNFINANGGVIVDVTLVVEGAVEPEPFVPVEYGPVLLSEGDNLVNFKIHNLGADEGQYKGNDCYVKYDADKAGTWNSLWHTDAAEDADNFAFFAAEDGGVYIKDVTANKFVTWKQNAEGGINWGAHQLTACQVTLVDAMNEAKSWFIVDDENTEGRYDILPLETANNGWSFMGGIDQDFVVLNLEKKTDRNIKWVFEQVEEEGETPVDPEPPVVEPEELTWSAPEAGGIYAIVNLQPTGNNFYLDYLNGNLSPVSAADCNSLYEWPETAKFQAVELADGRFAFKNCGNGNYLAWKGTANRNNTTGVNNNEGWTADVNEHSSWTLNESARYEGAYWLLASQRNDLAGDGQNLSGAPIISNAGDWNAWTTGEYLPANGSAFSNSFAFYLIEKGETPVVPEPTFDYAKEVAPVLAEANAALEGHDNVWVTTVSDKLITRNNQFSSNNSDPQEGSLNNLLDGNAGTFWHSNWHQGNSRPMHSDYLQIELDEAIDGDVLLTFVRRAGAANDQVTLLDVETSMDGQNFAHAAYIDMPNSGAGKTEQKVFALEEKAKFLRFWADATTNNRAYWHCGDFQLQTVVTNLNIDAPDYAYPDAVAALQEAIATAQAVENGTQEDVDALAAAVEAYKAALAGYPEFTEWTGDVQVNAGNVTSIDDLLNVDFCFNRALSAEASGYGVLGVVFDHTGDAYALAFDALFGGVEVEKVKADGFVGNVAHVQFEKIADLTAGLQDKAKGVAAKIGGFQAAEGHALVVLASKSFLVDGEQYNALVKADYELTTGTITGVENLIMNGKGEIYDLQGRRVNNAQNGLFIQNGRVIRK